jgi:ABC-2 type transport system ATP-binding protein
VAVGLALPAKMAGMIRTWGLTKRYRRRSALSDISLEIPDGGVTALVGPNGAGKSTLLKLCIGFERPTAGRLEVNGVDPVRDRASAVASVGFVPQTPSLYRDLTIDDHVDIARSIRRGFDPAYARSRVEALGLPGNARVGTLSGGEQAQVCLAIALGTRAPLLLLDEPLASLDPLARRDFLRVAREAARAGDTTIVLSSHVISEIEDTADRLLVLGEGRVLFEDSVAHAINRHRVVDEQSALAGGDLVSQFPGRGETQHWLIRRSPHELGRAASLEEVVLGYLAAGRASNQTGRPATVAA